MVNPQRAYYAFAASNIQIVTHETPIAGANAGRQTLSGSFSYRQRGVKTRPFVAVDSAEGSPATRLLALGPGVALYLTGFFTGSAEEAPPLFNVTLVETVDEYKLARAAEGDDD